MRSRLFLLERFFFKYPIKLKVLSVISIFSLLKSKPAGNYIKSKGNFKIGKKYQQPNKKPKENKSAATQENVRKWQHPVRCPEG